MYRDLSSIYCKSGSSCRSGRTIQEVLVAEAVILLLHHFLSSISSISVQSLFLDLRSDRSHSKLSPPRISLTLILRWHDTARGSQRIERVRRAVMRVKVVVGRSRSRVWSRVWSRIGLGMTSGVEVGSSVRTDRGRCTVERGERW